MTNVKKTKNQVRFVRATVMLNRYLHAEGFRWCPRSSGAKSPSKAELYGVWAGSFKSMKEAKVISDSIAAKMAASISKPHVTDGAYRTAQRSHVSGKLRWGKAAKPSFPISMIVDRIRNEVTVMFDLNDGSF